MDKITEFMVGLAMGGGIGFLTVFFSLKRLERRNRLLEVQTFKHDVEAALENARLKGAAANGLLLRMHNGGFPVTATSPIYSTCIAENPKDAAMSAASDWVRVRIDRHYFDMLVDLQQRGMLTLFTMNMPDCMLRRKYENLGVVMSVLLRVYDSREKGFFYVSFPYTEPAPTDNDAWLSHLEMCANKVRNLLEDYHRRGML